MKRASTLILAALMACLLALPAHAATYYPISVEEYTYGPFDQLRIDKVYELSQTDDPKDISGSGGPYRVSSIHCAGWAMKCSDAAFGNLPWRRVDRPSWDEIRPGDLVEYTSETTNHVVVVVRKTDECIFVTESGLNNKTRWGGQYFRWWLEEQPEYILFTRYPQ